MPRAHPLALRATGTRSLGRARCSAPAPPRSGRPTAAAPFLSPTQSTGGCAWPPVWRAPRASTAWQTVPRPPWRSPARRAPGGGRLPSTPARPARAPAQHLRALGAPRPRQTPRAWPAAAGFGARGGALYPPCARAGRSARPLRRRPRPAPRDRGPTPRAPPQMRPARASAAPASFVQRATMAMAPCSLCALRGATAPRARARPCPALRARGRTQREPPTSPHVFAAGRASSAQLRALRRPPHACPAPRARSRFPPARPPPIYAFRAQRGPLAPRGPRPACLMPPCAQWAPTRAGPLRACPAPPQLRALWRA